MFDTAASSWTHCAFKEVTILVAWNIWKIRNMYFYAIPTDIRDWMRMFKADIEILKFRITQELVNSLTAFANSII